jgi:hypothetical protein
MVFGWFFNFIFSVIFWIFPRLQEGVSRGNIKGYIFSFLLLNFGILIYVFGMVLNYFGLKVSSFYLFSSLFIFIGVFSFVFFTLPRVKPPPVPIIKSK